MRVWRICAARYASTAFSGEGSQRFPGRWHAGVPMVYTGTCLALAALEVFVNMDTIAEPEALVSVEAILPDHLQMPYIEEHSLGKSWRQENNRQCRTIGMEWFASRRSVALRVPSAAVMGDWNVLVNPEHPDFAKVTVAAPQPFRFDTRMFRSA